MREIHAGAKEKKNGGAYFWLDISALGA
jgi:hypothetical protein